jgi:citrate lyase beta subunit
MATRRVSRSGLTMPIVTRRFVDNAWRRGCDYINLDLEDSVPRHMKASVVENGVVAI